MVVGSSEGIGWVSHVTVPDWQNGITVSGYIYCHPRGGKIRLSFVLVLHTATCHSFVYLLLLLVVYTVFSIEKFVS